MIDPFENDPFENDPFENDAFRKAASEAARAHARETGCTIVEALAHVTSNPVNFSLPAPSGASPSGVEYEYTERPDGSVWRRQPGAAGWTPVKRPEGTGGRSVGR